MKSYLIGLIVSVSMMSFGAAVFAKNAEWKNDRMGSEPAVHCDGKQ